MSLALLCENCDMDSRVLGNRSGPPWTLPVERMPEDVPRTISCSNFALKVFLSGVNGTCVAYAAACSRGGL